METARDLAETTLFRDLDDEDLRAFAAIARVARFGPSEVVYAAGSAGDSLFVIADGTFVVRVIDENSEEIDVARLKPGTYFGEMEVVAGIGRTASIVSEGDGRCYRLDAAELRALLEKRHGLAAVFYERLCRELVTRLHHTTRDMGYFKVRAT